MNLGKKRRRFEEKGRGGEGVSEYGGGGSPVEVGDTAFLPWVPTLLGAWFSLTLCCLLTDMEKWVGRWTHQTCPWAGISPAILHKEREGSEGIRSRLTVMIDGQKAD